MSVKGRDKTMKKFEGWIFTKDELNEYKERIKNDFETIAPILQKALIDEELTWLCPFCGKEVTVKSLGNIKEAIEGSGYCTDCLEVDDHISNYEKVL